VPTSIVQGQPVRAGIMLNGLALIAIFVLQATIFYVQVATNIAPYYPPWSDQVKYLFDTYTIVAAVQTHGFGALLSHAFQLGPNGAIFPLQGALLALLVGLPRAGALSVHLFALLALEAATFWFVHRRTGRTRDAWIAVALIMLLYSPFFWAGGMFDFRIDFLALCQFGLWTILVLHSGLFRSSGWSIAAGVVAAWMACTRYISFVYFAPIMGLTFLVLAIAWIRARDPVQRADVWTRARNAFISGAITTLIVAPLLWINRRALYSYYFVGLFVSEEKEFREKEAGISTHLEHLLYYPKSLVFEHLGQLWLYVCGAMIVWFVATAIVLKRRPARELRSQVRSRAGEFWFLAAVLLFPLLILNTSIHKSPVVIGILCVPATLIAILVITSLRNVTTMEGNTERMPGSADTAAPWFKRAPIDSLLIIGIVAFAVFAFSSRAAAPKLTLPRLDQLRVIEMYDRIFAYIVDYDSERPVISIDRTVDYSPNHYNVMLRGYEQFGRLLKIEGRFGTGATGLFSTPREEALKLFSESSIIVLTDKDLGREAVYPMNRAIREYWDEIRAWTVENRIPLFATQIRGVPYEVFVKPFVNVTGFSANWVTSAGLRIAVDSAAIARWPFIVLEGMASYDSLGGEPQVRAVITNASRAVELPTTFKRTGPHHYRVVIDARSLDAPQYGSVLIHLSFDRFFVPKQLGLNEVTMELVVHAPTTHELRAQAPE
jgi:hypothetical protein